MGWFREKGDFKERTSRKMDEVHKNLQEAMRDLLDLEKQAKETGEHTGRLSELTKCVGNTLLFMQGKK